MRMVLNELMSGFTGDERLFMSGEGYNIEEVNIPIEYFTESEILDNALRNLILRYNKLDYINSQNINGSKMNGFKIEKNEDGKIYLTFELIEKCERESNEDWQSYQKRLSEYNIRKENGKIRPYRVIICDGNTAAKGLKISTENFLAEIDKLLDEKFKCINNTITNQFSAGEISRQEWGKKLEEMTSRLPASSEEYMKQKFQEFKAYYEEITGFDEYKDTFRDDVMVTEFAKDTISGQRTPGNRSQMARVNDVIPFNERDAFFRSFTDRKVISIASSEHPDEVIYNGYIIDSEMDGGFIIVMEPIDGDKRSFMTFEHYDDIDALRQLLQEEHGNDYKVGDEYKDIIADVLSKTKTEKARDSKIIGTNHCSKAAFERNMRFLITGRNDLEVYFGLKTSRAEMVR